LRDLRSSSFNHFRQRVLKNLEGVEQFILLDLSLVAAGVAQSLQRHQLFPDCGLVRPIQVDTMMERQLQDFAWYAPPRWYSDVVHQPFECDSDAVRRSGFITPEQSKSGTQLHLDLVRALFRHLADVERWVAELGNKVRLPRLMPLVVALRGLDDRSPIRRPVRRTLDISTKQ
jgi:hypothetical protein